MSRSCCTELRAIGWKRRKTPVIGATQWQHDNQPVGRADLEKLSEIQGFEW